MLLGNPVPQLRLGTSTSTILPFSSHSPDRHTLQLFVHGPSDIEFPRVLSVLSPPVSCLQILAGRCVVSIMNGNNIASYKYWLTPSRFLPYLVCRLCAVLWSPLLTKLTNRGWYECFDSNSSTSSLLCGLILWLLGPAPTYTFPTLEKYVMMMKRAQSLVACDKVDTSSLL